MKKRILIILVGFFLTSCGVDLDVLEYGVPNSSIILIFPENDSECTEGILVSDTQSEVIFKWNDVNDFGPYKVHLTNISTSKTEIVESETTEVPIVLERGIPYSWFVTGKFRSNSEISTFYNAGPGLESSIPLPATALSPVSGAAISRTSTTVNLVWKSEDLDDDIIGHDVYFGESKDPPLYGTDIIEMRYNEISVVEGKVYYWKIVTKDSIGNESTSPLFTFTVG